MYRIGRKSHKAMDIQVLYNMDLAIYYSWTKSHTTMDIQVPTYEFLKK